MPSTSDERRARVVTDTESVRSRFLSCISMRVSVVFPAPEGEERIRIIPRRRAPIISLDVLNLLAELLDLSLEFKPLGREAHVVRLRAERIGLPAELLRQEIEPPPDRAARRKEIARGG